MRDHIALCAYQTVKRIVLVASDLPENENTALAEKLAKPVVEHLRSAELLSAGPNPEEGAGRLSLHELNQSRRHWDRGGRK
jgi:hypothetical protein